MPGGEAIEAPPLVLVEEVGEHHHGGPAPQERLEELQGRLEVGGAPLRLVGEHLADHLQRLPAAAPGREEPLHLVGVERCPDPVAMPGGGQGQDGGHFGGQLPPGPLHGPEAARGAHVDQQQQGQLPLLVEALDEGGAEPGGDVPVDGPDVVAGEILPHLGELDPAAAEGAGVVARDEVPDQLPGRQLDPLDLPEQFRRGHGTGTAARMRSSIWSEVTPSASAW